MMSGVGRSVDPYIYLASVLVTDQVAASGPGYSLGGTQNEFGGCVKGKNSLTPAGNRFHIPRPPGSWPVPTDNLSQVLFISLYEVQTYVRLWCCWHMVCPHGGYFHPWAPLVGLRTKGH
jgi:hypothetical protein